MEAQSGRSAGNFVNIEGSLLSCLKDELSDTPLSMPQTHCIFEIPTILFRHNETSFLPNRFSIGPMHRHGNKNLIASEKIKVNYLKALLSTMSEESTEIEEGRVLSDWISAVKLISKQANACYEAHDFAAEMGEDEFVRMLLLDGVFIIELFRREARGGIDYDDPIFSMSCMLQFLHHDLILLENQIPWLVLETLFEITKLPSETQSLIELALSFFANTFTSLPLSKKTCNLLKDQDIKHVLDLLRLSLVLPSQEIKNKQTTGWLPIRSVTRLKQAGVKFLKVAPESVLDLKFRDGCLEIPTLLIQDTTETIFRNLIAYEQCLPHCPPIFTCYAKLLDNLVGTNNDMEILCKNEIFDTWLRTEDSTQFFNNLYIDTYVKEFYYSELSDKLDHHCKRWWPRWRAYYLQNFTKPWALVAQIYAVIMLVLTLAQTIK